MSDPAQLPDQRKTATILFADVVGSTQRIAAWDPESALELPKPSARCASARATLPSTAAQA